jgi:hypothetical protein
MAYQSLNIIGSFTAGTTSVQNQVSADRERVEAYRSLLRRQVQAGKSGTFDADALIDDVDDRMTIGDAPEEQRSPYLMKRYAPPPHPTPDGPDEPSESAPADAVGARLDRLV